MESVDPFVFQFSIFVMAVFVGYYVVWPVTWQPSQCEMVRCCTTPSRC